MMKIIPALLPMFQVISSTLPALGGLSLVISFILCTFKILHSFTTYSFCGQSLVPDSSSYSVSIVFHQFLRDQQHRPLFLALLFLCFLLLSFRLFGFHSPFHIFYLLQQILQCLAVTASFFLLSFAFSCFSCLIWPLFPPPFPFSSRYTMSFFLLYFLIFAVSCLFPFLNKLPEFTDIILRCLLLKNLSLFLSHSSSALMVYFLMVYFLAIFIHQKE